MSNETHENDFNTCENYIKEEAINMCQNFSPFLCFMGILTVANSVIKIFMSRFLFLLQTLQLQFLLLTVQH